MVSGLLPVSSWNNKLKTLQTPEPGFSYWWLTVAIASPTFKRHSCRLAVDFSYDDDQI